MCLSRCSHGADQVGTKLAHKTNMGKGVKAHIGIPGNEKADQLAKRGALMGGTPRYPALPAFSLTKVNKYQICQQRRNDQGQHSCIVTTTDRPKTGPGVIAGIRPNTY